jgi:ACR3 family arsenite efflux pump ArsB
MDTRSIKVILENRQIGIYFGTVVVAGISALLLPGTTTLEASVNPALALMLFVTFLQVPLADLRQHFARLDFLAALLIANFIAVPLLVAALVQLLPAGSMERLGVLLVLLTPCIDYVVTFSHLGRADAHLLLATTPALLILQMLLLPIYLGLLLGEDAAGLVQFGPFVHAFVWLIAVPLVLAAVVQLWAASSNAITRVSTVLGMLAVPATALVLFVVTAAVVPRLGSAMNAVLHVLPIYVAFAISAPLIGWSIGRLFRLDAPAGRSVAFSAATRNSLVVLPIAFAIPGAVPVLPAVIVAQTLVELVSELLYVRFIGKLGPAQSLSVAAKLEQMRTDSGKHRQSRTRSH